MNQQILGLHHVTAIANEAKRNLDFYTEILGLRLVKKTVNFDDPGTYHFYYGDEISNPGTIITFFPWEGIEKGKNGMGLATHIGFSISEDSYNFWKGRLALFNIKFIEEIRFKEKILSFEDFDGLQLQLIVPKMPDQRNGWQTAEISKEMAIKGFYNVTLSLEQLAPTARILCGILGYRILDIEGKVYRFVTDAIDTANVIDVVVDDTLPQGINAAGTNHHIAFRVADDTVMSTFHKKIQKLGLSITEKIDRDYFYAMYFREPGGILFEISSNNPGFTVDESKENLGKQLKLPRQYEKYRQELEHILPKL